MLREVTPVRERPCPGEAMKLYSISEVLANGRKAFVIGFINPAGVVAWLLQLLVFTTPGLIVSGVAIAVALFTQFPDRPWMAIAAPIYLLPMVFLTFIFMALSTFTDLATEWVFGKLWGVPDPEKLSHRFGYFMLSGPIWILVVLIFTIGDGGPCYGPARHCS